MKSLIDRLDKIEQSKEDFELDSIVLDTMEQIAQYDQGLQLLVERYSNSNKPIIARSLSFVLGLYISKSRPDILPLIFSFLSKVNKDLDVSTLLNTLNAIEKGLLAELFHDITDDELDVIYAFLLASLEYSNIVQRNAIAIISLLYDDGFIKRIDHNKVDILRKKLSHLMNLHDAMIDEELKYLYDFIGDTNV